MENDSNQRVKRDLRRPHQICETIKAEIDVPGRVHGPAAAEQAAVRLSLDNLLTYSVVRRGLEKGGVQLHGWLIDTKTMYIDELDRESGQFRPMVSRPAAASAVVAPGA